ncbi:MAG: anthranilate phosphoribosyltransferase [Bacteroidales bacterium]|jgi:anthranilate phosphoribosyltransferase|nr:anthranilate phosphoribosyltransferase [Bacteroidales bacterium]
MKHILTKMFDYQSLNRTEAAEVLTSIANGTYNTEQIASFITVYLMRPITMEELLGFREALLEMALPVDLSEFNPIDIVGTGGDGKNTFNISTLSCFVLAGAGFKVAKHGNYGATSVSGASNVLEYFGAKFTTNLDIIKKSLDKSGFTYLHAPLFNPAMKNVASVRKNIGVRTFFNVLGPLISPVKPKYQCLGVYNLKMLRLYTLINQKIGTQYTLVHSLDGYDEISLTETTKIVNNRGEYLATPQQLGFSKIEQSELFGGETIADAAQIFMNILENKATNAQRNAVLINSGLAIQTYDFDKPLAKCVAEADESLKSGKAKKAFEKFFEIYS